MGPLSRLTSRIRSAAGAEPASADAPPAGRPPSATGLELGTAGPEELAARGPTEELRFGLVLYGGVSLAIYIYGVVYEFWRLVRASQRASENAYSGLLDEARVTATVDIVSGASAGGINGIMLAKALTTGADMDPVRRIWVDEAHLLDLMRKRSEPAPRSLLSTERFEELLTQGLADMDADPEPQLVRVFDLFASTTRLEPWLRDFETNLGRTIKTADYHKPFRMAHRERGYNPQAPELGYIRRDFAPANNSVLAEIARATSAFPAAFEPRLIERTEATKHLYREDEPVSSYFSDGGILNNKPFTETIDAVIGRAADVKVRRWLVSVEPDPEHFAQPSGEKPEVDAVIAKAVLGIPRYQSIAADLERLNGHRARAERERDLLAEVDRRVALSLAAGDLPAPEPPEAVATNAYSTARYWQLCADLAHAIGESAAVDDVKTTLVEDTLLALPHHPTEATILFDYSFRRRRAYHLLQRVSAIKRADQAPSAELRAQIQRLWAQFDRIGSVLWDLLHNGPTGAAVASLGELDGMEVVDRVLELAPAISAGLASSIEDEESAAISSAIDALLAGPGAAVEPPQPGFRAVHDHYERWDQFVLPVDPRVGVPARDKILLARISPEDARHINRSAERKLAGDALFHFGGFLKREWRANDILWGRLDAAETIVRMAFKDRGLSRDALDAQIESVQREIVADELPDAPADYKHYLENDYKVGDEDLGDVPMQERAALVVGAADVSRNMVRGLRNAHGADAAGKLYRYVGNILGALLMILRWPVLAIWGDDLAIRRALSLIVLFIGGWTAITFVLVLTDVIDAKSNLWALMGIGAAIFVCWSVLLATHRFRRDRS